jgi:quercetin dioxygenase-like cupin family protein
MAVVHRYRGHYSWEGIDPGRYPPDKDMRGVTVRWLIGPAEEAPHFAVRYFEIEPGGWSALDRHAHEHGVVVLRGHGEVLLGSERTQVGRGDVIYIPPHETHQLWNRGDEPFGFLCVIPAREGNE